jgi:hypothetical protein
MFYLFIFFIEQSLFADEYYIKNHINIVVGKICMNTIFSLVALFNDLPYNTYFSNLSIVRFVQMIQIIQSAKSKVFGISFAKQINKIVWQSACLELRKPS